MDYKKLADLLYPDVDKSIDYYLAKYPKRNLKPGQEVVRIAPSPTGYLHTGHLYSALLSKSLARTTNGIFYMRLEDTDQKREIDNAGTIAYDVLSRYGLKPDEGYTGDNRPQIGDYGDYIQSHRLEIYNTFAKYLVSIGRAFPCFCEKSEGKEDVLARRNEQLENSDAIEEKDVCRNLTLEEIEANLKAGKPWALRLLSQGDSSKTFEFTDRIKGKREIRENCKDIVLVKSNGIPPYSFAHMVDDTLMGTTTVVRGEEWYPSLSAHIEGFQAFGFDVPKYAHTPVICKIDETTGNKRKLSKRKDPEADARYFLQKGYPTETVLEYLMNLLNSDFENWRAQNPLLPYTDFAFSVEKIGSNNPMFDMVKLEDISKNIISHYSPEKVADATLAWSEEFDKDFFEIIKGKRDYLVNLFSIDRVNTPKPRKDIAKWEDTKTLYSYMFDELAHLDTLESLDFADNVSKEDRIKVLKAYAQVYSESDEKDVWFSKVKAICDPLGFSADMKAYKKNPELFKGSVADVSGIIRVAITGRRNTPDLYFIEKLLGRDKVLYRLNNAVKLLSK